jgi:hypothetical protein
MKTTQSNELTRGTTEYRVSPALSFIGGVQIGAIALLDIKKFVWFGHIARLTQWGGGGYLTRSNDS